MTRGSLPAVVVAMAVVYAAACQRSEPTAPPQTPTAKAAPSQVQAPPSAPIAAPATEPADASNVAAPDLATTVDFSVPRTVSLAKNPELSFTITEATIEPRNPESVRLVLLVRMHNKQRQPADFADENFRLLAQDSEIPANGGLSETIAAGSESALERVQFNVSSGSRPRALQIDYGGETIELPLGLK